MNQLRAKFASFLWWTYPRGSLAYDVMVALILAFIFLTPRSFFHDQPRTVLAATAALRSHTARVVLAAAPAPQQPALAQALASLDRAAPALKTLSASAEVTDFTALVNDASKSTGVLYFDRGFDHGGSQPRYALDLTQPAAAAKRLVYRDATAWVYVPASHQVTKYTLGNKQNVVDEFLLLGMGATGKDLESKFEVTLAKDGTLAGQPAVHLTLTPRDSATRAKVPHLDLWYDPATWVAVQQQIWQPGGDYHLVQLSAVKVNGKLPGNAFSTDFHGATVVTPGS